MYIDDNEGIRSVIILGAGASAPFTAPQISTSLLNLTLRDLTQWKHLLEKITSELQLHFDIDETLSIISELNSQVGENNFENLIEIIDKISSFNFSPKVSSDLLLHRIMKIVGARKIEIKNNDIFIWHWLPFLYRQLIAEKIENIYTNNRIADYDLLSTSQRKFINFTGGDGDVYRRISIYSLNYDPIILDSISFIETDTDFVPSTISDCFDYRGFKKRDFLSGYRTIAFLHGNITFQCDLRRQYIIERETPSQKRIDKFKLSKVANNYAGFTTSLSFENEYALNFNTFITSGNSKDTSLNSDPYASYYHKLAYDIFRTNEIYLIGYSMRDEHINRFITNFTSMDEGNKIFAIDMIEDEFEFTYNTIYSQPYLKRLLNVCSPDGQSWSRNEELLLQHLNSNDYGWLHPQIFLFKKGYTDFLQDFHRPVKMFRNEDYVTRRELEGMIGVLGESKKNRRPRRLP